MESFILDQDDLENPVLETASKLLLSSTVDGAELRTVDPETQARLEALLEAAGKRHILKYLCIGMVRIVGSWVFYCSDNRFCMECGF